MSGRLPVLVWLVSLSLLVKGGVQLLWRPGTGYDLRLFWSASQYLLHGINPFDATFYFNDIRLGVTPRTVPAYLPDVGWPELFDYPPTSTLTQLTIYGAPSLDGARIVFLVASLAACAYLAWWAFRLPARDRSWQWLTAGLVLANLGFSQTIINGNYGALVAGALAAALTTRWRAPVLSGLCLGVALVKPTISAPFVLLFLAERRYRVLATCLLYLAASTAVTMWLADASVWALFRDTLEGARRFASGGHALWKVVEGLGASHTTALAVNAMVFLVPLAWLYWPYWQRWRTRDPRTDAEPWALVAATAVAARLFTYHNSIDNVVLLFVVVPLVQRASRAHDPWAGRLAAVVVLSLLLPLAITNTAARHVALYACWTAAAVYLVVVTRAAERAPLRPRLVRERVLH